jgi:hypothetical protein
MSVRTRKVKNPFNSYFAQNANILTAPNADSLAVAVIEKRFQNMPNMNVPLKQPVISGIEAFNMTNKVLDPAPRYVIVEYALTISNKYAMYDVVGTNRGNAEERLPRFIEKAYMNIEEPNRLPSVEETYRLSKRDLFGEELVALVANNLQKPEANEDPKYDLVNSLSGTLLVAAARLRIEAFMNKGMVGDLHLNPRITTQARFDSVKKLIRADEQVEAKVASNRVMQELLEEESRPKVKSKKVKAPTLAQQFHARNIAYQEQRAAAAALIVQRIPDQFLNPSVTTLDESGYMQFTKSNPRLNNKNQELLMQAFSDFSHKLEIQALLQLKRLLLENVPRVRANMGAHMERASKGGSSAKFAFQNRINALRRINNLISFRAGYVLSKRDCGAIFSPLVNCIQGRHTVAEHRKQLDAIRASLRAEARHIVSVREQMNLEKRQLMAQHTKRPVEDIEVRIIRKSNGTKIRQYLPKNIAKSALTVDESDPNVEEVYSQLLRNRGIQLE